MSYDSHMSDVFISYAKEDRARAAELAAVLESKGWTVWWDRHIPPGRTFDEVIEEALTTTRCVIVLWSALSVASRWVRAEASVAGERGILVPVLIEDIDQPLEFRRIQAANLVNWHGETDDPEVQQLLATVSQIVSAGTDATPSFRASTAASKAIKPRSQWPHFAAVALAGILIGAGLVYSLRSRAGNADKQAEQAPQTGSFDQSNPGNAGSATPAQAQRPATAEGPRRENLLSRKNGGHLLRAPNENWVEPIDDLEGWGYITGNEAVYGFRDDRPATFDTFSMLITEERNWNIKEFELAAGNETPDGYFAPIGKFVTQNVRLFPSPWQEFTFKPTRAKYLKVRVLSLHRPTGPTQVEQWQLLGTF